MSNHRRSRGHRSRDTRRVDDPSPSFNEARTLRLCRQVHERLELALGELDDPLLHGLWVHAVRPAAGTATLVVELVTPDAACLQETHARLAAARMWLRAEIAA